MTDWVCRQDGVVFPVGSPRCPMITCQARDAFEQGGDESINVYDAVAVTGIQDPGAAWDAVNSVAATARHELRQDGHETLSQTDGVASLLSSSGEAEVGARLGLVPGDPGAKDSSTDPVPVEGELGKTYNLEADGGEITEVDDTERESGPASGEAFKEDEPAGSAPAKKQRGKDVPS
jgi:hypothetical protein